MAQLQVATLTREIPNNYEIISNLNLSDNYEIINYEIINYEINNYEIISNLNLSEYCVFYVNPNIRSD